MSKVVFRRTDAFGHSDIERIHEIVIGVVIAIKVGRDVSARRRDSKSLLEETPRHVEFRGEFNNRFFLRNFDYRDCCPPNW
jgi:hypothetical protein